MSKIKIDPATIDVLTVIYSFNDASTALLSGILKMEEAKLRPILGQLTELGVLGADRQGTREILLRKHETYQLINKQLGFNDGMKLFDSVKYYEGIYQYQRKIQEKMPEAIKPVETAIKASEYTKDVANQRDKYSGINQKLDKTIRIMTRVALVLGAVTLFFILKTSVF
jgi:hypothetical protein